MFVSRRIGKDGSPKDLAPAWSPSFCAIGAWLWHVVWPFHDVHRVKWLQGNGGDFQPC